jgi:hypothetical protein
MESTLNTGFFVIPPPFQQGKSGLPNNSISAQGTPNTVKASFKLNQRKKEKGKPFCKSSRYISLEQI